MNKQAKKLPLISAEACGWQEGVVNVEGEHIELRYGDADTTAYQQFPAAAR